MPASGIGNSGSLVIAAGDADTLAQPACPAAVAEPAGVAVVDARCRYVYVNAVLAEFHGCGILDHAGREVRECLPGEMARVILPLHEYVLTQHRPVERLEFHARFNIGPVDLWEVSLWRVPLGVREYVLRRSDAKTPSALNILSPTELEVLRLLSQGRSTKEMAAERGVSVETIATHRKRISRKIRAHSTAELVAAAARLIRETSLGQPASAAPTASRIHPAR